MDVFDGCSVSEGDHVGSRADEGVLHAVVICRDTGELGIEAEGAGDMDGVQRAHVDRSHVARGRDDVIGQLDDRGGGDDAWSIRLPPMTASGRFSRAPATARGSSTSVTTLVASVGHCTSSRSIAIDS